MGADYLDFKKAFESKLVDPESALNLIQSGFRIVASMAAAEPTFFFQHLAERVHKIENLIVHSANPTQEYPCFTDKSLVGRLELNVMFLTAAVRHSQGRGTVHYVPQHLSSWAGHLTKNHQVDIFWGSCSRPDERGFVSLGLNACYEPEILRKAKKVVLEVNDFMPITFGATTIHINDVDFFVENSHALAIVAQPKITPIETQIAGYVADLIPNEATLQLGIGGIPNAIGEQLGSKRNLGIHTEMINDTVMDLFRRGIVTNRCKTIWPGKIVGAFAYGTQDLYDFIHGNPVVELQPASVVNDPYRIGRNWRMTSINTAVEIDLTGQVCSESVGHRELSGVGGASETHVGAQRSIGGRGIVAIPSTTKDGAHSKIVFCLQPGAKVSISRNDIDTVVTEYGVANLSGKSVAHRVKALASIAHPKFREQLIAQARAESYL